MAGKFTYATDVLNDKVLAEIAAFPHSLIIIADGKVLSPGSKVKIKQSIEIIYEGYVLTPDELNSKEFLKEFKVNPIDVEIDFKKEVVTVEYEGSKYVLKGGPAIETFSVDNDGGDGMNDLIITIDSQQIDTKNVDVYVIESISIQYKGEDVDLNDLLRGKVDKSISVDIDEKKGVVTISYDGGEYRIVGDLAIQAFTVDNLDVGTGPDLFVFVDDAAVAGDGEDVKVKKEVTIVYDGKEVGFDELVENDIDVSVDPMNGIVSIQYLGGTYRLAGEGVIEKFYIDNDGGDGAYDLVVYIDEDIVTEGGKDKVKKSLHIYYLGEEISIGDLAQNQAAKKNGIRVTVDPLNEQVQIEYDGGEYILKGRDVVDAIFIDNDGGDGAFDLIIYADDKIILTDDGTTKVKKEVIILHRGEEITAEELGGLSGVDVVVDVKKQEVEISYDGGSYFLKGDYAAELFSATINIVDIPTDVTIPTDGTPPDDIISGTAAFEIYVDSNLVAEKGKVTVVSDVRIFLDGAEIAGTDLLENDDFDVKIDEDKGKIKIKYDGAKYELKGGAAVEAFLRQGFDTTIDLSTLGPLYGPASGLGLSQPTVSGGLGQGVDALLTFDFLEIGTWENESLTVSVNDVKIDLGDFDLNSLDSQYQPEATLPEGVTVSRESSGYLTVENNGESVVSDPWGHDQSHSYKIVIPASILAENANADGSPIIIFSANLDGNFQDETYAIANFAFSENSTGDVENSGGPADEAPTTGRPTDVQATIDRFAAIDVDLEIFSDLYIRAIFKSIATSGVEEILNAFEVYQSSQDYIDEFVSLSTFSESIVFRALDTLSEFSPTDHVRGRLFLVDYKPSADEIVDDFNSLVELLHTDMTEEAGHIIDGLTAEHSPLIWANRRAGDFANMRINDLQPNLDALIDKFEGVDTIVLSDLQSELDFDNADDIIAEINRLTLPDLGLDTLASLSNDITQEIHNLEIASNNLSVYLSPGEAGVPVTIAAQLDTVATDKLTEMLEGINDTYESMDHFDNWSQNLVQAVVSEKTSEINSANITGGVGAAFYLVGGAAFIAAGPASALAMLGSVTYLAGSAFAAAGLIKDTVESDYGRSHINLDFPNFEFDGISALNSFDFITAEAEERGGFEEVLEKIEESEITAGNGLRSFTEVSMFLATVDSFEYLEIERGDWGSPEEKEERLVTEVRNQTKEMDDHLEKLFNFEVDWRVGTHGHPSSANWNTRNGLGDWTEEGTIDIDFNVDDFIGDNVVGFQARVTKGFLGNDALLISWHRDTSFSDRFDAVQSFNLSDVEWM
jgi:hypothetical protein